jgi:anti-sigma B factor antagonist
MVISESERSRPWFEVAVDDQGTTRTVSPSGEIDIASAGFVAKPLLQGLSNGFERVVLDLSSTTFIDSAGMAVVIGATEHARKRTMGFIVIPGPPAVQRVFDLCGYTDLVPFVTEHRPAGGI